ncbi:MAG: alpha/beta fold hydrolase, partial [Thermomicrobiales bacterium]|nr:alpha/beta fold hydrolase [Thermomicrobiales bacterium]
TSFGKVAAEIGPEYRAILLDRPGFAMGAVHPVRYTFAGDADALLGELAAMGVSAFHLAAHSYGALVAVTMALQAPERIKSLHLIEPPLLRLLDDDATRVMTRRVRELQADHSDEDLDATTTAFFRMIGAEHVPERLRGSDEWELLTTFAARFARNEPPGEFPVEHWTTLDTSFPVLLYSGGRSHPALQGVTHLMAKSPRVRRHTHVASAGHAVQMAGEAFWQPFLEEVADAEAAWDQRRPPAPAPTN